MSAHYELCADLSLFNSTSFSLAKWFLVIKQQKIKQPWSSLGSEGLNSDSSASVKPKVYCHVTVKQNTATSLLECH